MILIVSQYEDLHAAVIRGRIREHGYRRCHVVSCDRVPAQCGIDTHITTTGIDATIRDDDGVEVALGACTLLWFRRGRAQQVLEGDYSAVEVELINNDCRASLTGALLAGVRGRWISSLDATIR